MSPTELRARWARRDERYRDRALSTDEQEAVRLWRLVEARELERREVGTELAARGWVQPVLRGRL